MDDLIKCDFCGKERVKDEAIVRSVTAVTNSGVRIKKKISYCNDIEYCLDKGTNFNFFAKKRS